MDISVSEVPFQLRIGVPVPGFSAVDLTSTGINHLCYELMILNARLFILWANKDTSGFCGPARELWTFSFNCWLVGDSLDQMQLLYIHISLAVALGRSTFVFTLPKRRWYTVLMKLHNLNMMCCCSDQKLLWARCFCLLSIKVDIKYTSLLLITFLKLLCLKWYIIFKLIIFSVWKRLMGPH